MRETVGSATAPTVRCRNCLRGNFKFVMTCSHHRRAKVSTTSVRNEKAKTLLPADDMSPPLKIGALRHSALRQLYCQVILFRCLAGRGLMRAVTDTHDVGGHRKLCRNFAPHS